MYFALTSCTEVEKFVQANTQELAKDKWLCPLSGKKFKGPDFVRKHIFNKHGEKVEEVKKEVSLISLIFSYYSHFHKSVIYVLVCLLACLWQLTTFIIINFKIFFTLLKDVRFFIDSNCHQILCIVFKKIFYFIVCTFYILLQIGFNNNWLSLNHHATSKI